jgi:hypothetical protein
MVSAAFLWSAVKIGFYETWAMFFNMIISIYLAIFLKPTIERTLPSTVETPYGNMLTVLAAGAIIFLILQGISYTFFTSHFVISLPKILDVLVSGLLGSLAGFLLWSFVALLIFISPISQNILVQEIGFNTRLEQTTVSYLCWWCNLVNAVVVTPANKQTAEEAVEKLHPQTTAKKTVGILQSEPNRPAQTATAELEAEIDKRIQPVPPASPDGNSQPQAPPAP